MRFLILSLSLFFVHTNYASSTDFINTPTAKKILKGGERTLLWIQKINEKRQELGQPPLLLTEERSSEDDDVVFNMDNPYFYSPSSITQNFKSFSSKAPQIFNKHIFTDNPLPPHIPKIMSEKTFILLARQISDIYHECLRWKRVEEDLAFYTSKKNQDIRSYYLLKREKNLEDRLNNFHQLTQHEKEFFSPLLVDLCTKANYSKQHCSNELEEAQQKKKVLPFFKSYWYLAEYWWNYISKVPRSNPSVVVDQTKKEFMVPALDPKNDEVRKYLKENIEDEFRLKGWSVKIHFIQNERDAAFSVEFKSGELPGAINGNTIVLDPSMSFNEPEMKHIIRHEFGHILGFADCYLEFFDPEVEQVVYYEVDRSDLMCSRVGRFNQRMLDAMTEKYVK